MKKLLSILVLVTMVVSYSCGKKGINKVTITPLNGEKQIFGISWSEASWKTALKPYDIKVDLSNVSNISTVPVMDIMDKYALSNNSFIIKKHDMAFEQPFNIYEKNAQEDIPNFITVDSILHVYNLMCDYIIRGIEKERMIGELKAFTKASFKKSMEVYNGIKDSHAKKAALKNIAYFGIAMRLLELDLPGGIPLEANRIIDNDTKRIKSRWGSGTSEIFPYSIDYKTYIARGHYSRETEFRNYFLTIMWYGSTPMFFDMYRNETGTFKRMDEQIVMAIIMTAQTLGDQSLKTLWDDIYRVSNECWGKTEDITLYDLSDIIKVVYGDKIDFNKIWNEEKIKLVYELAKQRYNLHSGQTISGKINYSNEDNVVQAQFRLMGQIYNLDAHIYNNLTIAKDSETGQKRPLPKGLDIPAAFGNDNAYTILTQQMNEGKSWMMYPENIQRLRVILADRNANKPEDYSLNNSIYWVLKGYGFYYSEGYPSFMMDDSWKDKVLLTYVSSVSDAKHPTYITAKQGTGNSGQTTDTYEGDMPGYVEPDVKLYNKLEYMGEHIKEFLSVNNFYNSSMYSCVDNFIDTVTFLKAISVKELENKPFTEEEELRLKKFARELKSLTLSTVDSAGSTKRWETVPQVDRNMACITDAYIYENQVLQTAIGSPDYIYVVVPYKNKLYITRGSIYSYYEFVNPLSRKIEDSEWQDIVKDRKENEQQDWIKRITEN